MASLTATSVVSAAIISGDLIIGLSDGSVINCGRAQGPQGLDGPQGAIGSTGRAGQDGNTILTAEGTPRPDLGVVGDYVIDKTKWNIYGPKSSGGWGSPTPLRGNGKGTAVKRDLADGVPTTGEGRGGGDAHPPIFRPSAPDIYPGGVPLRSGDFWVDGNKALHVYYSGAWHKIRVYSDAVIAAGDAPSGSIRTKDGATSSAIAEAANGEKFANQYEFNNWLYYRVDRPPVISDAEPIEHPDFPVTGLKTGDFWINSGNQLFTWKANQWVPLFAKGLLDVGDKPPAAPQKGQAWFDTEADELTLYIYTGSEWVPAAPPVSLDGVNATIDAALIIQNDLLDRVQAGEAEQQRIKLDIEELGITKGSVARYKIKATSIGAASRNGELYVNNAAAADVQAMSFAPFDLNGQPIKPCNAGDIVELVQAVALANIGEVSRYRIVSGDSDALTVEYLSGTNDFEVDQTQEVYIYPQNEAGISKDYVDEGLAGKLNNAGSNELANDTDWKVRQKNASGSNKTLIQVKAGELGLYNLKEPNEAHHAATRGYVDSVINGPRPAQLSWIYDGTKNSASAPSDGKFYKNDDYLRFSFKTNNGVDLSNGLCDDTGAVLTEYGPTGVIWYYSKADNAWKMKRQFRTQSWRWNYNNHFEFMLSSSKGHAWSSVTKDVLYYITVGGWF